MTTLRKAADILAAASRDRAREPDTLRDLCTQLARKLRELDDGQATLSDLSVSRTTKSRATSNLRRKSDTHPEIGNHVARLRKAGLDPEKFDAALKDLLADRTVTALLLRAIAAEYTGTPMPSRVTRSDAERQIRQAFARSQWQDEAYRRIDNLNAAK